MLHIYSMKLATLLNEVLMNTLVCYSRNQIASYLYLIYFTANQPKLLLHALRCSCWRPILDMAYLPSGASLQRVEDLHLESGYYTGIEGWLGKNRELGLAGFGTRGLIGHSSTQPNLALRLATGWQVPLMYFGRTFHYYSFSKLCTLETRVQGENVNLLLCL